MGFLAFLNRVLPAYASMVDFFPTTSRSRRVASFLPLMPGNLSTFSFPVRTGGSTSTHLPALEILHPTGLSGVRPSAPGRAHPLQPSPAWACLRSQHHTQAQQAPPFCPHHRLIPARLARRPPAPSVAVPSLVRAVTKSLTRTFSSRRSPDSDRVPSLPTLTLTQMQAAQEAS